MTWVYLPPAISAPSAEEVPWTEPSPEYFEDLAASCTWRTRSLPSSNWRRVWKKEASVRRLCGPTFVQRQRDRSEAVQTWLSAAFPVPTSAWQGTEPASEETRPASSSTSQMPFAIWDRATFSWRTLQPSLFEDSMPFSGSWPSSVSMRNAAVFERPTLARHIGEIAGGASPGAESGWPSPRVSADRSSRSSMTVEGHWAAPSLGQMAELSMGVLPREFHSESELTPQAKRVYEAGQRLWPTANVPNGGRHMSDQDIEAKGSTDRGKRQVDLGSLARHMTARLWATASASMPNDGEDPGQWRGRQAVHKARGINGNGMGVPLTIQAQEATARLWATARASDYKSGQVSDEVWEKNSRPLTEQAVRWAESLSGHPCPTTPMAGDLSWLALLGSLPLSLNPSFVEWLMWGLDGIGLTCLGHPATATDPIASEGSVTRSAPRKRKRPSASSGSELLVSGHD